MAFSSIVLAGGRARRLGRNKLTEEIGGKCLIDKVIDALIQLGGDIILVKSELTELPPELDQKKVKIVSDIRADAGVLGGIYTGLISSNTMDNLVVAGDMPFLNPVLLRYLLAMIDSYDAVVPRLEGFIEPLHAVYTQRCLSGIKEELEAGRRDIRSFFSRIRVRYVAEDETDTIDPERLSFFNVNNEVDLRKAREIGKFRMTDRQGVI